MLNANKYNLLFDFLLHIFSKYFQEITKTNLRYFNFDLRQQ